MAVSSFSMKRAVEAGPDQWLSCSCSLLNLLQKLISISDKANAKDRRIAASLFFYERAWLYSRQSIP